MPRSKNTTLLYLTPVVAIITLLFSTLGAAEMDIDIEGVPLPADISPSRWQRIVQDYLD